MIDYRKLIGWKLPVVEHSYDADDTMLYALSLGFGEDPTDANQLKFVTESLRGTPGVVPTMAVVLGFPGSWMADPGTGMDFPSSVHGEEELVLHRPLPAAATVEAHHRVVSIVDKGQGRGALVAYDKVLYDKATGDKLATVTHTTFARNDGGFSSRDGLTDPAPVPRPRPPDRPPELAHTFRTLPQQGLLYRLCADRNPLHALPEAARAAGYSRPILHGLCTYGVACRAIMADWCDHRPERLRSMFARFSSPVYPGETLRVEMYGNSCEVLFRVVAVERDLVVLDAGRAEIGE